MKTLAIQFWSPYPESDENKPLPVEQKFIVDFLVDNKYINPIDETDCIEILQIIVMRLNEEFTSIQPNPITEIFFGQTRDQTVCPKCDYSTITYNLFSVLNLPFANGKNKIKDFYNKWSSWQRQSKQDARVCEMCSNKFRIKTKNSVWTLPLILLISIPRYNNEQKNAEIEIPRNLNASFLIEDQNDEKVQKYSLFAYINHFELKNFRHYVCHANVGNRKWDQNEIFASKVPPLWIEFDDTNYKKKAALVHSAPYAYLYAYTTINY